MNYESYLLYFEINMGIPKKNSEIDKVLNMIYALFNKIKLKII